MVSSASSSSTLFEYCVFSLSLTLPSHTHIVRIALIIVTLYTFVSPTTTFRISSKNRW